MFKKIDFRKWPTSIQLVGLTILAFALLYPPHYLMTSRSYIFTERDLLRALELIKGNLIFFGPELTGGGNLPGPFYYFLLVPPLLMNLGWVGTWYWMILLMAAAGAAGCRFLYKKFDVLTAFIWLILFTLLLPVTTLTTFFINPSFSILFIVLINICTIKAFTEPTPRGKGLFFIAACLLVSLAIQTHYTNIVYIFSLFTLQFLTKKIELAPVQKKYVGLGVLAFCLPLLPYLIWVMFKNNGVELGQTLFYGSSVSNSLPSLIDHFKISLNVPMSEFLKSVLTKIFVIAPSLFFLAIPTALVIALLGRYKKFGIKKVILPLEDSRVIKVLLTCLPFAFIPFSFYFFVPQGDRYAAPFAVTLLFLIVLIIRNYFIGFPYLKYVNVLLIFGLLVGFGALIVSKQEWHITYEILMAIRVLAILLIALLYYIYQDKKNISIVFCFALISCSAIIISAFQNELLRSVHGRKNFPVFFQLNTVVNKIYQDTGWTYSEAFERIYFINNHRESSFRFLYDLSGGNSDEKPLKPKAFREPDGYFVSVGLPKNKNIINWLTQQPLQREIKQGLLNGDITLGPPFLKRKVFLVSYYINNKTNLPAYFHNGGWGYNRLPEEALLKNIKSSEQASQIDDSTFLFKWNDCPDNNDYCNLGAIVSIKSRDRNKLTLAVRIVGLPLSQNSRWIFPTWTQSWSEPYVEVKCGDRSSKLLLATSIGYNQDYVSQQKNFKYDVTNNSILAPYERTFEIPCARNSFKKLSQGHMGSFVIQEQKLLNLPPKNQMLELVAPL